jgi:hypothetical protein
MPDRSVILSSFETLASSRPQIQSKWIIEIRLK